MNNMIITFEDGTKREYRKGTKFGEIVADLALDSEIICGDFNNNILNFDDPIAKSGKLKLYDINSPYGNRVYERGLTYLFEVCAKEVLGEECGLRIRHTIDRGIFFEIATKFDKDAVNELLSLSQRYEVAKMLREKKTYLEIAEQTGASTATISRVNRSLNYGNDGYDMIFERLNKE